MSSKVTVVFGVILELELGGKQHSLILQASAGQQESLKGSLKFTEELAVTDVINDLKSQLIGDKEPNQESQNTNALLKEIDLKLNEITLEYGDSNEATIYQFICRCQFQISQTNKLNIEVGIDYKKYLKNETTSSQFSIFLNLNLSEYEFKLKLIKGQNSIYFVAEFKSNKEIIVRNLVKCISEKVATSIPESLKVRINQILFIYCKDSPLESTTGSLKSSKALSAKNNELLRNYQTPKFLFGLDLSANINLSELPVVGEKLPKNFVFSLERLRLIFASGNFSEIVQQQSNTKLDNSSSAISHLKNLPSLQSGIGISIRMRLDQTEYEFSLPPKREKKVQELPGKELKTPPSAPINSSDSSAIQPTSDSSTRWYDIDTTFGPMRFKRLGFQWLSTEQTIFILLDASFSVCGFTLTVDGLAVGYSIKIKYKYKIRKRRTRNYYKIIRYKDSQFKYKIRGLALDYKNSTNTFQIGGAFLWQELSEEEKKIYSFKVAGGLILKTTTFTIAAIGAYAQFKSGDCSILIYAVLDKALGGDPAFFVTGLALGFGYNRAFKKPNLDNLKEFPLVKLAITEDQTAGNLLTGLGTLDFYLPPQKGSFFLAIGIKFTTYKLINSFVLLVLSLSDKWEFHILGLSSLVLPPTVGAETLIEPIAKVELGYTATFDPSEGTLKVLGKILPGSYLFSPEVKLVGGFAFYAWFTGEHQGDFVFTIGGYHPNFKVPAHYPQVEGVGFNIANVKGINLNIKGTTYFALTPSAIMAGGSWEATYSSDTLKASFHANVNLLVAWQPFHYDATINLNVHAEHNFTGIGGWESHDVSASLHIWGPEFSGEVKIDLGVTSETFTFGNASKETPTINWNDFQQSFLPKNIFSINIKSGLLKTIEKSNNITGQNNKQNNKIKIINPKEFCLMIESAIPFKEANISQNTTFKSEAIFGIAPMDVKASGLESSLKINITHGVDDASSMVEVKPLYKNIPIAMWGESKNVSLDINKFIKDAQVGFEIEPRKDNKIPIVKLEHKDINSPEKAKKDFSWEKFPIQADLEVDKNLLYQFMGLAEQEFIFSKSLEVSRGT